MTGIDGAVPPPYTANDASTATGGAPRLDEPHYGIGFAGAVQRFFGKYAVFSGRASRSEYWWATLFLTLLFAVVYVVGLGIIVALGTSGNDQGVGVGIGVFGLVVLLVLFAVIVPSIAVQVRRLHDGGFSGWLVLLTLIPTVGSLIIVIFSLLPSNPEGARYDAVRG